MLRKKFIAISLAMCISLNMFSACLQTDTKEDDKWVEDAIEVVPEEFIYDTCNQIYIDGEMYSFPCPVTDFLDNGWSMGDKEDEILEGRFEMESFISFTNDDGDSLNICLANETEDELKYSECTVSYIEVASKNIKEFMLPGGIAGHYDSKDDIYDVINPDMFTAMNEAETYESCDIMYEYGGDSAVSIYFIVSEMQNEEIDDTEYLISYVRYNAELLDYYNFPQTIDMAIDSVYLNDTSKIDSCTFITDSDAFVVNSRQYLAWIILYYAGYGVKYDDITDAQIEALSDAFVKIHDKNTYEIEEVSRNLSKQEYLYTFSCIDLHDVYDYAFEAANSRFEGNLDDWNESEEYMSLFIEEIANAYDVLEPSEVKITYSAMSNNKLIYEEVLLAQLGYWTDEEEE